MPEEIPSTEPLENPKKPFPWLTSLFVILAIGALAGLTAPMVIRCPKKAHQTEATSTARQIGLALIEFEDEYGSFPNDETAKLVKENHPSDIDLTGPSSNALFRQLFAAGITQSEQMFCANISGSKKPDGDIAPGNLLENGEVGFGYVAGLSVEGNPARPIAFAPIIPGTKKFDPKPFKGKAVVLRLDNSAVSLNIDADGHAIMGAGDMLSPENPIWDGKSPDIRYPE